VKKVNLDLRNVILLDNQSTLDLFCNEKMVESVQKSAKSMTLSSNGGKMKINKQATISGYQNRVWFSGRAITNIIVLSNIVKQYRVTYDSDDLTFVVHREKHHKPNMEFKMHESGLHVYEPQKSDDYIFVNTVTGNKEGFSK